MRVEMIHHITGTRDGVEWPLVGDTIELPDHEATDLIGAGLAKEASDAEAAATEDATEDGPDEATASDSDAPADDEPAGEPVKSKPAKKAAPKAEG